MKKGVSPWGKNFTGELVGIQISLEFIAEVSQVEDRDTHSQVEDRDTHIFMDCQGAIISAFHDQITKNKIGMITSIKESIQQISEKGNRIHVHWVPGHKEIAGNELADQQAKAGAQEMVAAQDHGPIAMDKREAIAEIKQKIGEKWKLKFLMSEKMERIQETFFEVGKRDCYGEYDRASFSALNKILCGHSRLKSLNGHQAKINKTSQSCVQSVKWQKLLSTSSLMVTDMQAGGRS